MFQQESRISGRLLRSIGLAWMRVDTVIHFRSKKAGKTIELDGYGAFLIGKGISYLLDTPYACLSSRYYRPF